MLHRKILCILFVMMVASLLLFSRPAAALRIDAVLLAGVPTGFVASAYYYQSFSNDMTATFGMGIPFADLADYMSATAGSLGCISPSGGCTPGTGPWDNPAYSPIWGGVGALGGSPP